jgi:hypothetical protein
MNTEDPTPEREWVLHNPVQIITDEDMAAYRKEMRLNPPANPSGFISPLNDESVQGYATDQQPVSDGVEEMVQVVKILEDAAVPCCMVAEAALIYYGAGRV